MADLTSNDPRNIDLPTLLAALRGGGGPSASDLAQARMAALGVDQPSPDVQRTRDLGTAASIIGLGNSRMGQVGQQLTHDAAQQESLRQGAALKMALAGITGNVKQDVAATQAGGRAAGAALGANARRDVADTNAEASGYRADRGLEGVKYKADRGLQGTQTQAAARISAAKLMAGGEGAENYKSAAALLKFGQDIDPEKNPGLKPYRDLMFQADRLTALARGDNGALKDLDPSQMEELGLGLHRIFTGANRTVQAQVAALVPHTAVSSAKEFQRWFTNEPTGTNQQAFVKMMVDTIDRERGVAGQRLHAAQLQAVARHAPAIRRALPDAIGVMQAAGLDPDEALGHVAGTLGAAPVPATPRTPAHRAQPAAPASTGELVYDPKTKTFH